MKGLVVYHTKFGHEKIIAEAITSRFPRGLRAMNMPMTIRSMPGSLFFTAGYRHDAVVFYQKTPARREG
jgi:hypothetical protein